MKTVRIMGMGQWHVSDEALTSLNEVDDEVEAAVEAGDEQAFETALQRLHQRVQEQGERVADDELTPSDVVLPPPDATVDDVRHLFEDDAEGLVPDPV